MIICNRYKNTLDHLIDSLNIESSDSLKPIDKRSRNTPRLEGKSIELLERNYLKEDVLNKLSQRVLKIGDF